MSESDVGRQIRSAKVDPRTERVIIFEGLTLSILTLHCHLHPLQAVNCCRNSRLVVDEDDLKWVSN